MPETYKLTPYDGLLESVLPNSVQPLDATRFTSLQQRAVHLNQRYLHVNFKGARSKEDVLRYLAESFGFPDYFGQNLDALADCLTDSEVEEAQAGFVVVLERLPLTPEFGSNERNKLLEVFHDVAEFWASQNVPFRVFYSFE